MIWCFFTFSRRKTRHHSAEFWVIFLQGTVHWKVKNDSKSFMISCLRECSLKEEMCKKIAYFEPYLQKSLDDKLALWRRVYDFMKLHTLMSLINVQSLITVQGDKVMFYCYFLLTGMSPIKIGSLSLVIL